MADTEIMSDYTRLAAADKTGAESRFARKQKMYTIREHFAIVCKTARGLTALWPDIRRGTVSAMAPMTTIVAFVTIALILNFLVGLHDAGSTVSTAITSRSLGPRLALALAVIGEFLGPLLFGVAIATTLGASIVEPHAIDIAVLFALLISSMLWTLLTWFFGMPSSASHALVGGLVGAAAAAHGWEIIQISGLMKVIGTLLVAPPLAFLAGFALMKLIIAMCAGMSPRVGIAFKRAQVATLFGLSLSHGANAAQRTIAVIAMGLVICGYEESFAVPFWVRLASAATIALGALCSSSRTMRTVGMRIFRVRPVDAFAAQTSAALVMAAAALLGGVASTTQVTNSALLGVGSAERVAKIRWYVVRDIAITWLFTLPAAALTGALLYHLLRLLA